MNALWEAGLALKESKKVQPTDRESIGYHVTPCLSAVYNIGVRLLCAIVSDCILSYLAKWRHRE